MTQTDIPYFSCICDQNKILDSQDNALAIRLQKTGWQLLQQQVKRGLNEEDLQRQMKIIANSYEAMQMNIELERLGRSKHKLVSPTKKVVLPVSLGIHANSLAFQLVDELAASAISRPNTAVWPTIDIQHDMTWNPAFTEMNLYNGSMGFALLFAMANKIRPQPRLQRLLDKIVLHFSQTLDDFIKTEKKPYGIFASIGAFSGWGSVIYTLYHLHQCDPGKQYKKLLRQCVVQAQKVIAEDNSLDIIDGCAGLLLVLGRVKKCLTPKLYNQAADACVQRLLHCYPDPAQLSDQMSSLSTQPLCGFSHGVAGMVLALASYSGTKAKGQVKRWIKAGLVYERLCFSVSKQDWPDFRTLEGMTKTSSGPIYMSAWCHGAAGIGLGRIGLCEFINDKKIEGEIRAAINTTIKSFSNQGLLSLCHGDLGNFDLLLTAAQRCPQLVDKVQMEGIRAALLTRIHQHGVNDYLQGRGGIVGLMMGKAGVAYELLRIAYPDQVPSVLLLDK